MPGSTFLRGERVTLRTVEEEDVDFLCDLVNDPDVWPYLNNHPPRNRVTEREFVEERVTDDESVGLLVCVGEDGETPAGTVGLDRAAPVDGSTEIGIVLAPEFWGEGYGTDASRTLTTYAFEERRIHRVEAVAVDENAGSCRIWERLGFREEGRLKEAAYHRGRYMDLLVYAVLEDEWEREASSAP